MIAYARLAVGACERLAPDAEGFHALALMRLIKPPLTEKEIVAKEKDVLATGSAFALLMAALGDHAHGEGNAFKRMDRVTAEKGYAGPVVVCSVSYEPIAGHRSSTQLIKYLSEGREIEIALASVAGTRLLAPFRVLIVSMRKPGDRRQSV